MTDTSGDATTCMTEFVVNGRPERLEADARLTLADALRDHLGLFGTHVGCEHGVCGACTVLVDGRPTRSCLVLTAQVDGMAVETVEGLEREEELHPLQRAFLERRAFQCGFCTPGFLMLGAALQRREGSVTDADVADAVASNLCRCTGYTSIAAALRDVCGVQTSDDASSR